MNILSLLTGNIFQSRKKKSFAKRTFCKELVLNCSLARVRIHGRIPFIRDESLDYIGYAIIHTIRR